METYGKELALWHAQSPNTREKNARGGTLKNLTRGYTGGNRARWLPARAKRGARQDNKSVRVRASIIG